MIPYTRMYAMHAHACDVAFMQISEWMLPIVRNVGCILSEPVCQVTGVLSDVRIMGMIAVPTGNSF